MARSALRLSKRYARKGRDGTIEAAYGFSLAPLLARSEELAQMAQQVAEERRRLKFVKERISICRRDIRKLISAAMEEGASGDWAWSRATRGGRRAAYEGKDRAGTHGLHAEVVNLLELQLILQKSDTNGAECRQHIQNSNTESSNELEPRSRKEQGGPTVQTSDPLRETIKAFPLGMVLRACPEIAMHGPGGAISSWRELMTAAVVVRSMLGVSPSAYQEACEAMGPENAWRSPVSSRGQGTSTRPAGTCVI